MQTDHRQASLLREERDLRASVDEGLTSRLIFGMANSIIEWYRPSRGLPSMDCAAGSDETSATP